MVSPADRFRDEIAGNITRHGQHVMMVHPTHKDRTPPFAYTIGNHGIGLPELLVVGLHNPGEVAWLLNTMGTRMRQSERAFHDGEIVSLGGKHPFRVRDASPIARDEYTIQAGQYWRTEDYRVQQVVGDTLSWAVTVAT